MQPTWNTLHAMLHCSYKAWQLARDGDGLKSIHPPLRMTIESPISIPVDFLTQIDKLVLTALCQEYSTVGTGQQKEIRIIYSNQQTSVIRVRLNSKKAQKLFIDTGNIINEDAPPAFYRNDHCHECQFHDACYKKLKERDCISLLSGMSSKVILKFHKKGIYSITQLSHLFRPRRRRRYPQVSSNYLWELKALAITDQKTYVLYPPNVKETAASIYLDFEGLPDEGWIYLIGVLIIMEDGQEKNFSFWADKKENEQKIFADLFIILKQYPNTTIYHYGSYETKGLKQFQKKWPRSKNDIASIETQMINLLGFLRTHVYPPIYSNGLKELTRFLGFQWSIEGANGLQSIQWRKNWENRKDPILRDNLIKYNLDDCKALLVVKKWFIHLATDAETDNVKQVAEMKKQSMFKLQNNPQLGEDFQFISKAAYFDYQRSKIYLKNKHTIAHAATTGQKPKSNKKGIMVWQPKKVNEVIMLPPLHACPKCGSSKVYQYKKKIKLLQTDLNFTKTGIRQHVIEYQATKATCGECHKQYNNHNLRRLQYGNNVFAYATNLYVSYNISNYMISKIMQEQFGIWISPMYLVMRKEKWWKLWQPEVDYIWKTILQSPVIHIDETSIHLENKSGYVWVFATTHTVFYHYTDTREGDFLHDWLKGYKGVLVTDFFPSYESLPIKRQKCLIHFIRDLNDDLFKNPFDEEYKTIVVGFNTLLRKIIETINRYGLIRTHLRKHLRDTEQFLRRFIEPSHKSELSKKYAKRFQKHWGQLWTFLHHEGVPWNNNNAEAAVKAFAQYRRGVKGMIGEHGLREYLKMLSIAQTCRYRNITFLSFLRRQAGLWQNVPPETLPGYLPFNQARLYAHKLGFQKREEWQQWGRSGKRPAFIPFIPDRVYKDKGWTNWADWVGFSFLSFEKARAYMRKLGLKNRDDYREWLKSKKRPTTVPHEPENIYKYTGWNGLGDWLGNGNIQNQKKKKLSYEQVKAYVQTIGIKTWQEYRNWSASGERPATIPASPSKAYYEFEGWGKFLGTDRVANQNREFWDYRQAKTYLLELNIRSIYHFRKLCKNGIIPDAIPRDPLNHYKKKAEWVNYSDFLSYRL
ncbi:IS66 family transposase [Chitinophagaceae bacterium LWZ2-11]